MNIFNQEERRASSTIHYLRYQNCDKGTTTAFKGIKPYVI